MPRALLTIKLAEKNTSRSWLIQQFRSEHADLFPTGLPARPEAEFLDQCAVIFQCTACGNVFYFQDAGSHRAECVRSSRNSWSIETDSTPAQPGIAMAVLGLLKVIGLPQDATLSSATEALGDVRFACLCGDPRYQSNFDFQGLVGTSTSRRHLRLSWFYTKLDHVISENQEYEGIKSKIVGKTRQHTAIDPALWNSQLINDHGPYELTFKIVRIDRGEPGYDDVVGEPPVQQLRVPAKRRWDHCDVCLRLTGTRVYFGGNPEFKRYHLSAR